MPLHRLSLSRGLNGALGNQVLLPLALSLLLQDDEGDTTGHRDGRH